MVEINEVTSANKGDFHGTAEVWKNQVLPEILKEGPGEDAEEYIETIRLVRSQVAGLMIQDLERMHQDGLHFSREELFEAQKELSEAVHCGVDEEVTSDLQRRLYILKEFLDDKEDNTDTPES